MTQRFPWLYKKFKKPYETTSLWKQKYTNWLRSKYSLKQMEEKLSKIYLERTGNELDWNNLTSYTEKMQWAKIYDNNPLKTKLSDKYRVREWIKEKIGEEYLIPLLGVWERPEDIDFEDLPSSFVLKLNNGSGDVKIIKDKSKVDRNEIVSFLKMS